MSKLQLCSFNVFVKDTNNVSITSSNSSTSQSNSCNGINWCSITTVNHFWFRVLLNFVRIFNYTIMLHADIQRSSIYSVSSSSNQCTILVEQCYGTIS